MRKRRRHNHRNIPFEVFNHYNACKNLQETARRFNMSEDAILSIVNSYSEHHIIVLNKTNKSFHDSSCQQTEKTDKSSDETIDSVEELIKNLHTDRAIYASSISEPHCGIWCKMKRFFRKILFMS